jgi:imidazolonepropionase-like amidohydrolase
MGLGDRLGSLAEGKTASMVLLRANPLEDIGNARNIEAVFLRGRYFDRASLDRMLEEARERVQRP